MKRSLFLRIVWMIMVMVFAGCSGEPRRSLVVSEVTHFSIQGNGKSLSLPIFAGTLDITQINREIGLAEYYYDRLSSVYDFKSFTVVGSNASETLIEQDQTIREPQSVYSYEDSTVKLTLSLTGFSNNRAQYSLRISDKHSGQVRDHTVEVPSGQSASIGSLYDPSANRGYILAVSTTSLSITNDVSSDQLLTFLKLKNTPRGSRDTSGYKPEDQRWVDEILGEKRVELPIAAPAVADTVIKEQPFDTPPKLIGGIEMLAASISYPASAKRDSVEGKVLVDLLVGKEGKVLSLRVAKGVRADLDSAAVSVLRTARFEPAMYQGQPVNIWVTIPILYRLKDKP